MKAILSWWRRIPSSLRMLVSAFVVLLALYGPILLQPNNYLFGDSGDGLRTYYAISYYVANDSGNHLTGLNYPFGEMLTYVGAQPLLSNTLKGLHNLGLPILPNVIGILNLLMLLSIVVSQYLLFKILRHYGLPTGWAIGFGILIGLLSPQIGRITGHYGLSYMFFVPLSWWLYIRWKSTAKNPWFFPALAGLSILLCTFLHPYYLALALLFYFGIALAELLGAGSIRTRFVRTLTWVLVVVVPYILVQVFMAGLDSVADRPVAAWGFHFYRTDLLSLLIHEQSPIYEALRNRPASSEALAYLGTVNSIALIVLAFILIRTIFMRQWERFKKSLQPPSLSNAFVAATLALLFAMGVPFVFGLESITEWLYPLTQFRSVGRFAWIFYIVFSVLVIRELFRVYRVLCLKHLKSLGLTLLFIVGVVWSVDAFVLNRINFWRIKPNAHLFYENDLEEVLEQQGYEPDEFQAIFPIPHFNVGNEIWGYHDGHYSSTHSIRASYHLQLPILAHMGARISQHQSLEQIQLFSDPKIYRTYPNSLPNDKPLLILAGNDPLKPWDHRYLDKGKWITELEHISLYSLPVSALRDSANYYWQQAQSRFSSMMKQQDVFLDSTRPWFYYDGFDNQQSKETMLGKGSHWARRGEHIIASYVPEVDTTPVEIEVSVWLKSYWRVPAFPELAVKRYDKSGKLIYIARYTKPTEGRDIYKQWVRFACTTWIDEPGERVEVSLSGPFQMADELLIRPKVAEVWTHVTDSGLTINNYPVYPRP